MPDLSSFSLRTEGVDVGSTLLVAVMLNVGFGGLCSVVMGMLVVAMSCVRVMRSLLVVAGLVMLCSLFVMTCGVFVVFGRFVMMLYSFL
jgi:hypothetical protein